MNFNFDWLLSPKRKRLLDQQVKNEEARGTLIEKQIEAVDGDLKKEQEIKQKLYKKLMIIDKTVIVTLHDGTLFSNSEGGKEFYEKVKNCYTVDSIIELFLPKETVVINTTEIETKQEKELVRREWSCLENHADFEVKDGEIYLKKLSMPLPAVIVAAFIEVVEKMNHAWVEPLYDGKEYEDLMTQYTSLKLFTLKLALNPIQSSREDALKFIRNQNIRITSLGNLIMYRGIVSVGESNKELSKFVSTEYFKIKKWKKSPSSYYVWTMDEGYFTISKDATPDGINKLEGNLQELYNNLGSLEENRYTDAHTHSMDIRIGEVYSIPEEEVDVDSRRDCSNGLHVGSRSFGIGSFGDTKVLCLVNPAKIRSVPIYDGNKMRVSEMFIAAVIEIKDGKYMDEDVDIVHFDEEYHAYSLEELQDALKERDYSVIKCQDEEVPVSHVEMEEIVSMIDIIGRRVVKV